MTMTETFSSVNNFPFSVLRANQEYILKQIDSAFASDYRYHNSNSASIIDATTTLLR